MKQKFRGRAATASLFVTLGLLLAACSGSGVDQAATSTEDTAATAECGEVGIAMHAWVGYTATANVLTEIAKKEFGCTVNQVELAEAGVTYDAMEAGSVDVVVEDWGGGRWQEWVDRGTVVVLGPNGQEGLIGMYVPKWMADEYPDITDSANLNKYADLFKTSESDGKGAWLEGPPGYTTIGEKMIEANKLNYKAINTTDNVKQLMQNILKTRKTVKYYVWYNLAMTAISMIIVFIFQFLYDPSINKMIDNASSNIDPKTFYCIMLLVYAVVIVVFIGLIWLFYRLLYGILMRRLQKNYDELKKIDY